MSRAPAEGRYSKVTRRIWNDSKFRALSAPQPNAQTLWLRLLTGPELGCIPGLFSVRLGGLADAMAWPKASLKDSWKEIEDAGLAFADWEAGLVWVPNAVRHNEPESPNVVRSWRLAWAELPESDLRERARKALENWAKARGPAWEQALSEAMGKPSAKPSRKPLAKAIDNQDQDQDQDQEQEQDLLAAAPSQDLTGSARARPPAAAATEPAQDPESWKVPCPDDLALLPAQVKNLAMKGVTPEAIQDLTFEYVGSYLGKPNELRSPDAWRAGLWRKVSTEGQERTLKLKREPTEAEILRRAAAKRAQSEAIFAALPPRIALVPSEAPDDPDAVAKGKAAVAAALAGANRA